MRFHTLSWMSDEAETRDPAVESVLATVPEFAGRYVELVHQVDAEPGAAAVFSELADFVADLAYDPDGRLPLLGRCLAAVEAVAMASPDAVALVGWAFLDSLSPDEATALRPQLGPRTRELLDRLDELGGLDDGTDPWEDEDDAADDDEDADPG